MTILQQSSLELYGNELGPISAYPALKDAVQPRYGAELDEDAGLFLGCGMLPDPLPYRFYGSYDTPEKRLKYRTLILENQFLRAVFLPELGGRLWQLYDKEKKRDLIYANRKLKFGNLAIANAWFAGGIEWNFGRRGHDAQTCERRFAAVLPGAAPDGGDVLRFYEFSRDRAVPFQVDFFLPEESRFLYARTRIVNTRDDLIFMYAWTNIAVEQRAGDRIIVPAQSSYVNRYQQGRHFLTQVPLPNGEEDFDLTYPCNIPRATDHFFRLDPHTRPWEAAVQSDGYGLLECSTARLRGRKLFVWGSSQGGRHWQRKLLGDDHSEYLEIQAGLARTQMECLPMPPKSSWEYLEAFGPIQIDPQQAHGDWETARRALADELERQLPASTLEALLTTTRQTIALKPGQLLQAGSGWGALEEARIGRKLASQLDFGKPGAEQLPWLTLLQTGHLPEGTRPESFLVQAEYLPLLERSRPYHFRTAYALALFLFRAERFPEALRRANQAEELASNAYVHHLKAHIHHRMGKARSAGHAAETALRLDCTDPAMVKDLLKLMVEVKAFRGAWRSLRRLSPELRNRPLIQFLEADVLAHLGKTKAAKQLLMPLDPPDIREGENSLSELYLRLEKKPDAAVPFHLDLRMNG